MSEDPIARFGALFEREGDRVVPTELARGPWDPNALHGGAPSALFAAVCEAHDPGPAAFVARLTVEMMRPIPLAPLVVSVDTIRPGKKVQWLVASLRTSDGTEVAHCTALRLRSDDVDTVGSVHPVVQPPPGPDVAAAPPFAFLPDRLVGYWTANELRLVRGEWDEPGPGTAWIRLRCPVIAGVPTTPIMRVAAAADFGSGVGNPLRFTSSTAINAEVTIHVHRHPAGEWIGLESGAWAQPHGVGLADTMLWDERGVIGRGTQSLLVESLAVRPRPG